MKYQIIKENELYYIRYKHKWWPVWTWVEHLTHYGDAHTPDVYARTVYDTFDQAKIKVTALINASKIKPESKPQIVYEVDSTKDSTHNFRPA